VAKECIRNARSEDCWDKVWSRIELLAKECIQALVREPGIYCLRDFSEFGYSLDILATSIIMVGVAATKSK